MQLPLPPGQKLDQITYERQPGKNILCLVNYHALKDGASLGNEVKKKKQGEQ